MKITITGGGIVLTLALLAILVGCGLAANSSEADIAEPVFLASITVLVFLLPAAGLVGPRLTDEAVDAAELTARNPTAGSHLGSALARILKSARWMRIGFPCTLAAVILSSFALLRTGVVFHICGPRGELNVDHTLGGLALGLLIGTALAIFPMTWNMLQFATAQRVYDELIKPAEDRSKRDT
ncbi:hypothetical protein ACIA98_32190 [Streptomyces sp. NPDC051366]|uniref:hypothetical protein n=1 Tax=Streptomyces sp. NPDC051366 TaxID=3365652 RepID=UPI00379C3394